MRRMSLCVSYIVTLSVTLEIPELFENVSDKDLIPRFTAI